MKRCNLHWLSMFRFFIAFDKYSAYLDTCANKHTWNGEKGISMA